MAGPSTGRAAGGGLFPALVGDGPGHLRAHRDRGPFGLAGWALLAFFAWRVTRGGRISRMLLVVVAGGRAHRGGHRVGDPLLVGGSGPAGSLRGAGGAAAQPGRVPATRPAGQSYRAVALWRRRRPAPLVAALAACAVLGLAGASASAAVISARVRGYHSETVRVLAGHPVLVTLPAGRYGAFGGCADEWGCAQLAPRDLSVAGAVSGPVGTVAYTRLDDRTDAGQLFNRDLTFAVPAREAVRIALNVNPRSARAHRAVSGRIRPDPQRGNGRDRLRAAAPRRAGGAGVADRPACPAARRVAKITPGNGRPQKLRSVSARPAGRVTRAGRTAGWTAARAASRCSRRGRRP